MLPDSLKELNTNSERLTSGDAPFRGGRSREPGIQNSAQMLDFRVGARRAPGNDG
jgi:hypothetical protein